MIILLLLCLLPNHALAEQLDAITLATQDMCPTGCYDNDGNFDGTIVKPIRYALNKMGIALHLNILPWPRAQLMAQEGRVAGFFAASRNWSRDEFAVRSTAILPHRWNWYFRRDSRLDPSNPNFKATATIGSKRGANTTAWLKENGYNVKHLGLKYTKLTQTLLAKRCDALFANAIAMEQIITDQHLQSQIRSIEQVNTTLGVYFTKKFLAKHPGFLSEFNRHIEEYKRKQKKL